MSDNNNKDDLHCPRCHHKIHGGDPKDLEKHLADCATCEYCGRCIRRESLEVHKRQVCTSRPSDADAPASTAAAAAAATAPNPIGAVVLKKKRGRPRKDATAALSTKVRPMANAKAKPMTRFDTAGMQPLCRLCQKPQTANRVTFAEHEKACLGPCLIKGCSIRVGKRMLVGHLSTAHGYFYGVDGYVRKRLPGAGGSNDNKDVLRPILMIPAEAGTAAPVNDPMEVVDSDDSDDDEEEEEEEEVPLCRLCQKPQSENRTAFAAHEKACSGPCLFKGCPVRVEKQALVYHLQMAHGFSYGNDGYIRKNRDSPITTGTTKDIRAITRISASASASAPLAMPEKIEEEEEAQVSAPNVHVQESEPMVIDITDDVPEARQSSIEAVAKRHLAERKKLESHPVAKAFLEKTHLPWGCFLCDKVCMSHCDLGFHLANNHRDNPHISIAQLHGLWLAQLRRHGPEHMCLEKNHRECCRLTKMVATVAGLVYWAPPDYAAVHRPAAAAAATVPATPPAKVATPTVKTLLGPTSQVKAPALIPRIPPSAAMAMASATPLIKPPFNLRPRVSDPLPTPPTPKLLPTRSQQLAPQASSLSSATLLGMQKLQQAQQQQQQPASLSVRRSMPPPLPTVFSPLIAQKQQQQQQQPPAAAAPAEEDASANAPLNAIIIDIGDVDGAAQM